jgi:hypothetical protein
VSCSYNWKCDKCPVYDDRYACPHFMGIKTYIPPVFRRKPRRFEYDVEKGRPPKEFVITDEAICNAIEHGYNTNSKLVGRFNRTIQSISARCRRLSEAGKIRRVKGERGEFVYEVV